MPAYIYNSRRLLLSINIVGGYKYCLNDRKQLGNSGRSSLSLHLTNRRSRVRSPGATPTFAMMASTVSSLKFSSKMPPT